MDNKVIFFSNAAKIAKNLRNIENEYYEKRKITKANFNFFSAIVNSRYNKEHIEKYHSNFIAYLLNPKENHDFGDLFLKHFLQIIKPDFFDIIDVSKLQNFNVEREKMTKNGRFIDITLELGTDWIIFIENKIWSAELNDQMKDYCDFAENNYNHGIGIYLSIDGRIAESVKEYKFSKIQTLNCNYNQIIKWLEACVKDDEVKFFPHIESSIKQYILVLKNILQIMKEDKKALSDYLIKIENRNIVAEIAQNQRLLYDSVLELIKEVRNCFLTDLENKIQTLKSSLPYNNLLDVKIHQGDYMFSGDEENSYGLGFTIKIKNENVDFNYGGAGYGGIGNCIFFKEQEDKALNTHYGYGIDKANSILISNFGEENWKSIVEYAANKIIQEIEDMVLPKIQNINSIPDEVNTN